MRALVATDPHWQPQDGRLFSGRTARITVMARGHGLPAPESGWIAFAVMTRPGPDGSGHIELFANDRWVATVRGHVGHDDPGLGSRQYFKFGPYRTAGRPCGAANRKPRRISFTGLILLAFHGPSPPRSLPANTMDRCGCLRYSSNTGYDAKVTKGMFRA
jgi:hypothetical protein